MARLSAVLALFALLGFAQIIPSTSAFAASGKFVGASNHVTTGTATLKKKGSGWVLELGSDFTFDGAPDPKWAFGKNGVDKSTIFTKLKKNKGKQSYKVPANIDPSKYTEVILWCEKFSVPLGVAKLR